MQITENTWIEYITRLAKINETAGQKMADYIARHGTQDTGALIAYAQALVQKYGEGSAELACQMYDAMAEASGADVPPAVPAEPADYNETAKMVNATKQSPPQLQGGVSRLVKRAGADTTLKNAIRDGAEWAWVPHGDTCAFCITLASRGWQRASKKALKGDHAEHIHAHCNCEYAVRFDSRTTVAGYDPEKYLTQYNAHGGDINAMRREQYAKNKDKINDQKRAAYAARMDRQAVVKPGNGKAEKSAAYKDVTLEMYAAATPNSHRVQDLQEYAVGGMTYKVDGHNVQLDYSAHEKEIAELLERELGGEIYMVPRVNNPQGVRTPDYLFRGKGYDLKTLESKAGQNTIYQRIKKGKKQAENFVVDVSKAEQITEEIINKQVEKIFSDPETAFVNEVVIVRDGAILKAAKKKHKKEAYRRHTFTRKDKTGNDVLLYIYYIWQIGYCQPRCARTVWHALLHLDAAKALFHACFPRVRGGRALFIPKYARHGVKLYSPRERPRKKHRAERIEYEARGSKRDSPRHHR